MEKDEHSNIFEEAGKRRGKKKKKKVKSTSSKKPVPVPEDKQPKQDVPKVAISDEETDEMLKKLRNMDEDLQSRMSRVCELSGMSSSEVQRYIENPDNFSMTQWSKIQHEKEALEDRVYAVIGLEAKKRKIKKKKKKMAKGRRGKTLGSRKGWIQM